MTRTSLLVGAILVVAGCSGGSGGTGGGSGGGATGGGAGGGTGGGAGGGSSLTADQACTNLANATCGRTNTCFPFAASVNSTDLAGCIARSKLSCIPTLATATSGSTPASVDACAKAIAASSCADLRAGVPIPACKFSGMLAAGTGCGSSSQCVSGYCKLNNGNCGVCSAKVGAGGSCGAPEDCADGSTCLNGVCTLEAAAGTSCGATKPCKRGLWCKSGVCAQALTTSGAACDSNIAESCDFYAGLFCADGTNVCTQVQVASAGNSCGFTATSYVVCAAQGTCQTGGGVSGSCLATSADGAACNPNNDLNCLEPAACMGGVCKLPNPATCP